jgi:negative regulator of sigma-B (phosphoserine phosphatase)
MGAMSSAREREPLALEWGWAGKALEAESGDLHVVSRFPRGALVGVIDGLGHGAEAAVAAREAARVLEALPAEPLVTLFERCHEALHGTRGAVMSLASIDSSDSRMTWIGVGNVEGILLRGDPTAAPARDTILLRGGIVGYQLPTLRPATIALSRGDTLILASDGIHGGFGEGVETKGRPQEIAEAVLARHGRGDDDAHVLVVRFLGGEP